MSGREVIICSRCGHDHWCEHDDLDHGFCCQCDKTALQREPNNCGPWAGINLPRTPATIPDLIQSEEA